MDRDRNTHIHSCRHHTHTHTLTHTHMHTQDTDIDMLALRPSPFVQGAFGPSLLNFSRPAVWKPTERGELVASRRIMHGRCQLDSFI